jgi:predicted DNA-binding transcriptional regulator YafY
MNEATHLVAFHSMINSGFRWHVRGYCAKRKDYRDFVIGRILGTPKLGEHHGLDFTNDINWYHHLSVIIEPHPKLSPNQKKIIELDYGMKRGSLTFEIRKALAPYYLKMLHLDEDDVTRPPNEQQIILKNKADVLPFIHF